MSLNLDERKRNNNKNNQFNLLWKEAHFYVTNVFFLIHLLFYRDHINFRQQIREIIMFHDFRGHFTAAGCERRRRICQHGVHPLLPHPDGDSLH